MANRKDLRLSSMFEIGALLSYHHPSPYAPDSDERVIVAFVSISKEASTSKERDKAMSRTN